MIHEPELIQEPDFVSRLPDDQAKNTNHIFHINQKKVILNSQKFSNYIFCVHKFTVVLISYCLMTVITKEKYKQEQQNLPK